MQLSIGLEYILPRMVVRSDKNTCPCAGGCPPHGFALPSSSKLGGLQSTAGAKAPVKTCRFFITTITGLAGELSKL